MGSDLARVIRNTPPRRAVVAFLLAAAAATGLWIWAAAADGCTDRPPGGGLAPQYTCVVDPTRALVISSAVAIGAFAATVAAIYGGALLGHVASPGHPRITYAIGATLLAASAGIGWWATAWFSYWSAGIVSLAPPVIAGGLSLYSAYQACQGEGMPEAATDQG